MQVKVNLKIFIFLIIFLLTRQIKIYAFLMFFAFVHELGHLFAGIILHMKPKVFEIAPYGFSISFEDNYTNYNKKIKKSNMSEIKKILIAAAGPIVNLIIILITYIYYFISKNNYIFEVQLDMIIYSNLLIFIFNLLPIYPLDGGRILKGFIHIFAGLRKSYSYINLISNITLIILTIISSITVLIYKNVAIIIILVYLWIIVVRENVIYEKKEKILDIAYCKKAQ